MPNRILRDWTDSEAVNDLTFQAEVFFTRLIMKVDDFGRFSANPKLLKSLLFPIRDGVRDSDISRDLAACEKAGLIAVYETEGKPYLQIRKFGNTPRAKESKFPPPASNLQADACKLHANARNLQANAPVTVTVTGTEFGTECECDSTPARASGFPTVDEAKAFAAGQLLPTDSVENWHSNREAQGWVRGNGIPIANWQSDLRSWINREGSGEFKQNGKTNNNNDHRATKRAREHVEEITVPDLC